MELKFCKICVQMTNHKGNVCLKCNPTKKKEELFVKKFKFKPFTTFLTLIGIIFLILVIKGGGLPIYMQYLLVIAYFTSVWMVPSFFQHKNS